MPTSSSPAARLKRATRPSTRPVWCAALATMLLASLFPYFEDIHSANELARLYLADSLVHDHTVAIDGSVRRHTHVPDKARRNGKTYSDKAPGITAAIGIPLLVVHFVDDNATLATKMRVARLFGATLPLFFLLFALARFLARRKIGWRVRCAVVLGLALCSPLTVYGVLLFGHCLAAALIFGAFVGVDRIAGDGSRADFLRCVGVGAAVGFSVSVEYPSAVFLVPTAILYCLRVLARRQAVGFRPALLAVGASILGAAPFVGGVLWYHQVAFGSPFATGYEFLVNKVFANVHAQGFMGISVPNIVHFGQAFFSPQKGVFVFAPLFVVAIAPGLWRLKGLPASTRWAVTGSLFLMALFVSSMVFPGGGWTVSQRHLVPWLPFAAVAAAFAIGRMRSLGDVVVRVLFVGGCLAGLAMCGASLLVWPYLFDDLQSPVAQLIWPALVDGWRVPSTLALIGLPSWWTGVLATVALVGVGGVILRLPPSMAIAPKQRFSLRGGLVAASVLLCALFVGVFVVTAPDQTKTIAKRRARLERDYQLDPSATPRRRTVAPKPKSPEEKAKARAKKRKKRDQKRKEAAKKKRHQRAASSAEGKFIDDVIARMTLQAEGGDGVRIQCRRRGAKVSCSKFGAGVFARRMILDDTVVYSNAAQPAPRANKEPPVVTVRTYLPRKGGALILKFPEDLRVRGLSMLATKPGVNVSLSTTSRTVTLGQRQLAPKSVFLAAATKTGDVEFVLRGERGDREIYFVVHHDAVDATPNSDGGARASAPVGDPK